MRVGWLMTLVLVIAVTVPLIAAGQAQAQEMEGKQAETCPLPNGWDPVEDLPRILAEHRQWLKQREALFEEGLSDLSQGWANLCNANLYQAELNGADLREANLNGADLREADLNGADLRGANLDGADLREADLNGADLQEANLNRANLREANLNGADLQEANLNRANLREAQLKKLNDKAANLTKAKLNGTNLYQAELNGADLQEAELNGADLREAELNGANLSAAKLNKLNDKATNLTKAKLKGADLREADLNEADLQEAELNGTNLHQAKVNNIRLVKANLTATIYAPVSPPPDPYYVADLQGLQKVTFPEGWETGLVQFRETLQKSGLRDLEREATYAIEHGRTWHLIDRWNALAATPDAPSSLNTITSYLVLLGNVADGVFRLVAFEATTGYGLYPNWALGLIAVVWVGLGLLVYFWPIYLWPHPARSSAGIYRVWSTDRIETGWDEVYGHEVEIRSKPKIERLECGFWFALMYAVYFSLLSTFHIGWRDLNVGTWISRIQPREYALRATGWVRVVSGLQSLLSVYLLAIWALTYFGRPFQ